MYLGLIDFFEVFAEEPPEVSAEDRPEDSLPSEEPMNNFFISLLALLWTVLDLLAREEVERQVQEELERWARGGPGGPPTPEA